VSPTKRNFADTIIKGSGSFANLVQRAINANPGGAMPYVKAREDAEDADREYRIAVRKLDRQRLGLEERVEDALKNLQRWEADRLRAVKTVLLQFQGTLAGGPKALGPSRERCATLIAAFQPEQDLAALIERYRTGPFRPAPHVYESVAHDEADVLFGWADGGWDALRAGTPVDDKRPLVPPVLKALLDGMIAAYRAIPDDGGACVLSAPAHRTDVHGRAPEGVDLRGPARGRAPPAREPKRAPGRPADLAGAARQVRPARAREHGQALVSRARPADRDVRGLGRLPTHLPVRWVTRIDAVGRC
jgi:hypothetical protein